MSTLMVLAGSGVILFVLYILSNMVFDHEDRIGALELAWGRNEVTVPTADNKEEK